MGAFWKTLEPALAGARRIYFPPDGVLNQVALGIVPRDDGRLLMETYDLRMVSSTKDLLRQGASRSQKIAVHGQSPLRSR